MNNIQLEVSNLIGRKYVQGSYIISAVVTQLASMFESVTDFDLRIRAPLYGNPVMMITDEPMLPVGTVASGSFTANNKHQHYYLTDTGKPITSYYEFDEAAAENSIEAYQDTWILAADKVIDDPFIGWSVIERSKNLEVFQHIDPPGSQRKMWFTGIKFSSLDFLKSPAKFIQSSINHKMVTPNCISRAISYNGIEVGQRFAVGKLVNV